MLRNAASSIPRRVLEHFKPSKPPYRLSVSTSSEQSNLEQIRRDLRVLLRETAQPVAIVTSLLHMETPNSETIFHGATLSSFTSVALDPHPLVAFSLRVPSRMASSLNALASHSKMRAHMVINILSASQAHLAHIFSRPDLHPHPFSLKDDASPQPFRWTRTKEGLPILSTSLGAISCTLVGRSWPLSDLQVLEGKGTDKYETQRGSFQDVVEVKGEGGITGLSSDLFIARVTRIEDVHTTEKNLSAPEEGETDKRTLPLLYHRRRYGTISDIHRYPVSER